MLKNKKHYRTFAMITIVAGLTLTSCSKSFLELEPHQSVSTDQALMTLGDYEAAIIGAYDGLSSSNYYGRYFVLVSDIMSDDVKQNSSANRASDWAAYAGSSTDSNSLSINIWSQGYSVIDRCNRIILNDLEVTPATQDALDHIKGQAHALRALVYFDLVRLYAQHYTFTADASHMGVPLVLDIDPFQKPARSSVKETYDLIISDLNTALGLMANGDDSFFMTRGGINGLLSRVYLYQEDWENAAAAATQVIESNVYSLVPTANYLTVFSGDHSEETIFEINMHETDNRGTDGLGGMYLKSGYGDYLPSKDLLDLIPVGDVRNNLYITDPDLTGNYASKRVNKYSSPIGTDNTPVIRLPEILLNRAEAYAHIPGREDEARADLDLVRKRGLPTAADATASGAALIEQILLERRIELANEGHRLYDLTRNKKGVDREDCTSTVCTVDYPNDKLIMAIGQYEIEVNENVEQNPGY